MKTATTLNGADSSPTGISGTFSSLYVGMKTATGIDDVVVASSEILLSVPYTLG